MIITGNNVNIGDIIDFFERGFNAIYQYFKTFAFSLDGGSGTWYVLLIGIPVLVLVIRFLIAPLFRGSLNLRSPGSDPVKSDLNDDFSPDFGPVSARSRGADNFPDGIDSRGREYYY